ncbi:unnamed protein product [Cyclocybe aegerita]|uniref:Protein RER1 n=1 Tax=Cyclocybe aegerita TaxID=1973307 RepID=A0A8S0W345_CYCAE|nr:unnamed protein product [Cyclocybe aegerita]
MMNDTGSGLEPSPAQNIVAQYTKVQRSYQQILDKWTPYMLYRWLATAGLLSVFFLRIVLSQGPLLDYESPTCAHTYVRSGILVSHPSFCNLLTFKLLFPVTAFPVCYAHAIYLLNLLLAFLQPKFDPSLEDDLMADEIEEGGDPVSPLPSQRDDEFRPFVRRLPEWQFWLSATRATIIALFCTFSEVFDVPVYWPILVVYFFTLFALTMRRQIQHMIKYKYIPFDIGRKARYGSAK